MTIVFFADRTLGRFTFPDTLRDAGIRVEKHYDHFNDDEDDVVWIREVAKREWYAISNDRRIYKNPVERHAVLSSGLGYFVIPGGHLTTLELAENFVTNYPAIERFIRRSERPFIASIARPNKEGKPGKISLLWPKDIV